MSWIKVISYDEAEGKLKRLYDKVTGPNKNIDNIMMVHGLRPHTMTGHMGLYKNVLHNSNNTLPKWFLETIGVYVSYLNRCDYCVEHHSSGLKRLLDNNERYNQIQLNLQSEQFCEIFDAKYEKALIYAKLLTLNPFLVSKNEVDVLLKEGFTNGEVLEINQVAAYFNYANRTVLGLGVNVEGDILGLSPNNSSEENNWNHQ